MGSQIVTEICRLSAINTRDPEAELIHIRLSHGFDLSLGDDLIRSFLPGLSELSRSRLNPMISDSKAALFPIQSPSDKDCQSCIEPVALMAASLFPQIDILCSSSRQHLTECYDCRYGRLT